MKNYFKILIMVSFTLILSCCGNDSNLYENQKGFIDNQIQTNSNYSELEQRLQAFNDSLVTSSVSCHSSIDKSKLEKGLKIVFCDVKGAYNGAKWGWRVGRWGGPNGGALGAAILGPIVAAAYSYNAANHYESTSTRSSYANKLTLEYCIAKYSEVKRKMSLIDINQHLLYISLNFPEEKNELLRFGTCHNLMLDKFIKSDAIQSNYMDGLSPFEKELFSQPRFKTEFNSMLRKLDLQEYPEVSNEEGGSIISLYLEAIENTANSYSDVEFISNRYISEVLSSTDIVEQNKNDILSSISVMASTSEYWGLFTPETE